MASIDMRRKHGMTLKSARSAVDDTAARLGSRFSLRSEWIEDTLHFDGSGVRGTIHVTRTVVHVRAELGFLLGALRPIIESEIERQLEEHFG